MFGSRFSSSFMSIRVPKALQWPIAAVLVLLSFGMGAWMGDRAIVPWFMAQLNPNNPSVQSQAIFEEAFQRAKNDYRDPSMNHQQWEGWRQRYQGKLSDPTDAYMAIETILASLNDEYSRFLPPNEMHEQSMQINAELYGIGVQMGMRNGRLTVVTVLDNSPAKTAKLSPQDIITHINGVDAAGMDIQAAADEIRGPVGTPVRLTIETPAIKGRAKNTRTLQLKRAAVHLQSVTIENDVPKEIGHIRLSSFLSETMMAELETALETLKHKQALIIDVRGNFGGLVDNAVAIADRFLDQGIVVIVQGPHEGALWHGISSRWQGESTKGSQKVQARRDDNDLADSKALPIVILMDGNSASASEILCAALHDNHRATLVGTDTFGKGLVQKIIPLSDGSGMNLSVARYLTPRGEDIHKKGIQPDIRVADTPSTTNADPQLQRAIAVLKQQRSAL